MLTIFFCEEQNISLKTNILIYWDRPYGHTMMPLSLLKDDHWMMISINKKLMYKIFSSLLEEWFTSYMIHIIYELYIFFKIKTFSILSLAGHIPGANLMVKFNQFLSIKKSLALLEHFFSLFLKDNFVNLIFYFIFLLILILSYTHT